MAVRQKKQTIRRRDENIIWGLEYYFRLPWSIKRVFKKTVRRIATVEQNIVVFFLVLYRAAALFKGYLHGTTREAVVGLLLIR
jgi:hypothetical protein